MLENLSKQTVKGYELYERIGAGAFGAVYRAYQSTVGREVAVKIILPGFAGHPDFIRRFEMEAQLVARLEHLHIVPLYDFWRDPGGAYLVMRWLRGGSLADALQAGPFDLPSAARLLDQVAAGLAAAHRRQIVHRDIKPSNILLDEDGNAYLSDFGIARDLGQPAGSSQLGDRWPGTPDYLSPEQIRGELVSPQSDIFALGLVLYEILAGRPPFSGLTPVERMYRHLEEPLPDIDLFDSQIGAAVNEVLHQATEINPRRRYRDVLGLTAAFRRAVIPEQSVETASPAESLTQRELEILGLIVRGSSNKEIAQELYIELTTVKWYITQLYRKLNVRGRMQAILRAHELQLLKIQGEAASSTAVQAAVQLPVSGLVNPYKGLRPFELGDSGDFYGREALVERLARRLGSSRFLAVVGPSGSGKSSLLNAGLIPALRRGVLTGSERWFIVTLAPGVRPLDELEVALGRVAADQGGNLRDQLERDPAGLLCVAGLLLPLDGSELVLVIDQLEEIYSPAVTDEERQHFLDLLLTAAADPQGLVRVVTVLRADFYDRPLLDPHFGDLIRRNLETVLPLSAEEFERAITLPAKAAGVSFEPGLVPSIIEDVQYQPGALPLLQYALTELFDHRQGSTLTHEAYTEIGGVVGALARRADEIYRELSEAGRETARQIFLRLVSLGEGDEAGRPTPDIRRRAFRSDLLALGEDPDQVDDLLETFAAYRLLSLDNDPLTRKPTVALAHEALLREWDRLGIWIDESRDDLRQHARLSVLCAEWSEAGRAPGYLLSDVRLEGFTAWAANTQLRLSTEERAFLEASLAARQVQEEAELARQRRELETARRLAETERQRADEGERAARSLRRRALWLTIALLVASGLALVALAFSRQADTQRRLAVVRELASSAINNLNTDPELSILLSLAAVDENTRLAGPVLPEVEDALHRSVQASRVIRVLPHGGAVAVSPDGSRIATGGEDNLVKFWDAAKGTELRTLAGATGAITDVSFSPDGKRLAAASRDGQARIWDTRTGELLLTLDHRGSGVFSLAFSPQGERLATGGEKTVKIWDSYSGEEMAHSSPHTQVIGGLAFTPQGDRLITTSGDGYIKQLNGFTGKELSIETGRHVVNIISGLGLSPSGRMVAIPSGSSTATIWDLRNWQSLTTFNGHSGAVQDLKFSPDGRRLATGSEDGTARVWDSLTGQELVRLAGHRQGILRLAFTPDGNRLVTSSLDGTTRIWDITPEGGREWLTRVGPASGAFSAAFSPDGEQIIAGFPGRSIQWEVDSGKKLRGWSFSTNGSYSPDGTRIITTSLDGTLALREVATGNALFRINTRRRITAAALSPDGSRLATGGLEGALAVWDAGSGEKQFDLDGHSAKITDLTFSRDGNWLVTAGEDCKAIIWDLKTRSRRMTLDNGSNVLVAVSISPDGKRIATAGADGISKVWELATGEELLSLKGHSGGVQDIGYSPDGKRLATAGLDATARLWDTETGQELLALSGSQAALTSVAFSPDGRRLVTSSIDSTIRVYALDLNDLITLARSRLTRSMTEAECQRYLHRESCPP